MSTRREFFQRTALLAAIQRAFAIDPPKGSTFRDAEHIVVLMQENRSFDHSFGTLRGVRGFNDPRAVSLPDQNSVWCQTNAAGETYTPFRLNIKETKVTWLGSLPHGWRDQTDARNHGNMDGWLDAKASGNKECIGMPFTLGYFTREDLPFYYALADAFTVCDQNFCSSLTGTTPNRLHLWTGTIRENQKGSDPANVRNSEVDYPRPARWTTFPERLEEAGVSWRVYQNELSLPSGFTRLEDRWLSNFTDNPLEWFDQYHVGQHPSYQRFLAQTTDPKFDGEKKKWTPDAKAKMTAREQQLHAKAFTTNTGDPNYRQLTTLHYKDGDKERQMQAPKGDVLHQFRQDVQNGKLPTISWLVPPSNYSDHPGAPWYGAWFLAEAMNILTHNPEVWKRTIFVLTYDENDGYFDHIPPFVTPNPRIPETGKVSPGIDPAAEYVHLEQDLAKQPPKEARGGPIGLGYRVPMVVASPWSRGGYVCSQVFDHTSVIQLMEQVVARKAKRPVRETNISAWRRAVCGDMASAFRPYRGEQDAPLPYPGKEEMLELIHKAQFRALPTGWKQGKNWTSPQEKGTRPSTALPYEHLVDGSVSGDGKSFVINMKTGDKSGAPFHCYTPGAFRNDPKLRTRAYALTPASQLTDSWELAGFPNQRYHLRLHGPNGFYREFAGSAQDPRVDLHCVYANGSLEVRARNPLKDKALTLTITDESYGAAPRTLTLPPGKGKSAVLPLAKSSRWYDFRFTIAGAPDYARRYAGRVENGEAGISDPAMAG